MDPRIDYCALFGVLASAEDLVIHGAYRALAERYHPDRYERRKDEATLLMAKINDAYRILSNAAKRAEYDIARSTVGCVTDGYGHERWVSPTLHRKDYRSVEGDVPIEVEVYRSFVEKLHEWGYSAATVRTELVKRGVPESTVDCLIRLATGLK
jgi:curved DNA-binding protein CbpA